MSTSVPYDHRLVQTAVVGDAHSDHPVILPMDAAELDAWRRRHPHYTYWCGYELGGCGGKLMDRLYHDKVCHFAHVSGGPTCGRAATGESSADHLFIKRGLRNLLGKHGQRGTVATRDLGSGPGDAVDLHLPAARRRLRFQLSRLYYRGWRAANLALADDVDEVDWLFGTDGPLTEELLARKGYSLRFRLETVGGERRVHIGTRTHDEPSVHWHPLEDCRITQGGLLTPSTETVRVSGRCPKPFAFPIDGPVLFALAPEAPVPDDSSFAGEGRRLVAADVKPSGSPIVRAILSLPNDTELPPAKHVYRATDHARLLVREGVGGWVVSLNRFVRLNAHEAARTGLAQALPEPPDTMPTPAPRAKQSVTLTRNRAVVRVRELLTNAAPRGRTMRWSALAAQLGAPLVDMPQNERAAFLVEVDSPLQDNKPVVSILLREDDGGLLRCLPAVLDKLGVKGTGGMSADSSALRAWAERERERTMALCVTPSRETSPRKPDMAKAEQPKAPASSLEERRRATQEKERKTAGRQATPHTEIEQLLIAAACQQQAFTTAELELLRSDHRMDLSVLLMRIDRAATGSTPLLSSLVTDEDGAPLPYFRDVLRAAGYRAPQTDKALKLAWRREQERAYAAYADPPQPLPERLV
ncbi:hypothetical protein [Streptomyces fungicidicus]